MARVLIVEDEPSIVMAIRDEMSFEGFDTESVADGRGAIEKARVFQPDVLLLDLMLPGMNGFEVCRRLRPEMPDLWIIMLTARGQEVDRVLGLELGADDYVTKPFSLRELVARVKVGLRRRSGKNAPMIHKFGDVEINLQSHRVTKRGAEIQLTRREFDMLELLFERAGQVITRDEFLDKVWGEEVYVTHRVIDTHIAALRRKLEDDPNNPRHILSVRGLGYKLD
ncbi:MAG: response regulator transcription factor [Acidobacteriota bacterium]